MTQRPLRNDKLHRMEFITSMYKKIIYIDLDRTFLDYDAAIKSALNRFPAQPFPQSRIGFFRDLKPYRDAINAVLELDNRDDIDVYFLTAPSVLNLHCYTEKVECIVRLLGDEWAERVIISTRKDLCIGDLLIDDCEVGAGQEVWQERGKLIKCAVSPEVETGDFYDWSEANSVIKRFL
ncbi:hypothetical protein BCT78_03315 [Vibrio breoganii]|nr:hypothetical protein B003_00725 [Vibrio breoganii 1C10]PML42066.1 hypothetical protein BCT78_03315 [Vibrio breoganii]